MGDVLTDAVVKLCDEAIEDASHWPTDWHPHVDTDGDHAYLAYWCATSPDGDTTKVEFGEDYDRELTQYIARMNKREPKLARILKDMHAAHVALIGSGHAMAESYADMMGKAERDAERDAERVRNAVISRNLMSEAKDEAVHVARYLLAIIVGAGVMNATSVEDYKRQLDYLESVE